MHLCVYLQPVYVENGQTSFSVDEPPLARADLVVAEALRLPGRTGVVGHQTPADYSLAVTVSPGGTRFDRVVIHCGGAMGPDGWFTKRFWLGSVFRSRSGCAGAVR